jgi:hypothetical protein
MLVQRLSGRHRCQGFAEACTRNHFIFRFNAVRAFMKTVFTLLGKIDNKAIEGSIPPDERLTYENP